MGWWKKGDALAGDGPVDLFEEGMSELAGDHGKPSWQAFLNAFAAAVGTNVKASFAGGASLTGEAGGADAELRDALSEIVANIQEEYRDYVQRDATAAEIAATVLFSLRVRPERFLSGDGPIPELEKLEVG